MSVDVDALVRASGFTLEQLRERERDFRLDEARRELSRALVDGGWSKAAIGRLLKRTRGSVNAVVRDRARAAVPGLVARLDQADELETAQLIARLHGLTIDELLVRRPPRDRHAGAIVSLYLALAERGHSTTCIGHLTGRSSWTVHQGIRSREVPGYVQHRETLRLKRVEGRS